MESRILNKMTQVDCPYLVLKEQLSQAAYLLIK